MDSMICSVQPVGFQGVMKPMSTSLCGAISPRP